MQPMATAKRQVNLVYFGVTHVRQKKAITGGLVLEIPGPDSNKKADALAEKVRMALVNMGVLIARPIKSGELRVMDLDESITKQEVAAAIAEAGGCPKEDVKVGDIRFNTFKLGTAWVRCPLTVVRKLADIKHVQVGWVSAKVQILAARQLQCSRCLEMGHVRKHCTSLEDRSLCCYKCGDQGHKASECRALAPKCPVCASLGRPANHRLGGPKCNPPSKKRSKGVPSESSGVSKTAQPANKVVKEVTDTARSAS